MPTRKRQPVQLDPLADVDTNRPFPRLHLTDAQWGEICRHSTIPESSDDARKSTEIALGMFRQFEGTDLLREHAAEIRQELRSLAKDTKNLSERLSNLLSKRAAYMALTGNSDSADDQASFAKPQQLSQIAEDNLSQICDALLRAPKRLLIAAHRVKDGKRGPKSENIRWLVGNLDGIREQFTGKIITRSYKDPASVNYVTCVCRIADPTMGAGTIVNAIRERIAQRRKKNRG
jgi:hypothetical protein